MIVQDHAYHGHTTGTIDISPYKFNVWAGQVPLTGWKSLKSPILIAGHMAMTTLMQVKNTPPISIARLRP